MECRCWSDYCCYGDIRTCDISCDSFRPSNLFANYNNIRRKLRLQRVKPTTPPSNFCPAFAVVCDGVEVVAEKAEEIVELGIAVVERGAEDS
jgi:hypothetical protein